MTVWMTGPNDPEARLSSAALLGVAVMVLGLALWGMPSSGVKTATIGQAISSSPSTPVPTFVPHEIQWSGYVRRVFVSGSALEIAGSDAPGGVFQAYASGQSPVLEGRVLIRGTWQGTTCAYGGDSGRCVPEVGMESIEQLPVEPY